ncbi:MAG TPA: DUF1294 domain-containing protein [Parvibaculum sp.]|jgi:uncharacterized membrane protein YsdA (DUF1294 family)
MTMLATLALYLLVINGVAFAAFAWDKRCAERDLRRMPEKTLLTLAAIGGAFGAVYAQQKLRHKTQKEPFRTYLNLIAVVNVAGYVALCVPSVREAVLAELLR